VVRVALDRPRKLCKTLGSRIDGYIEDCPEEAIHVRGPLARRERFKARKIVDFKRNTGPPRSRGDGASHRASHGNECSFAGARRSILLWIGGGAGVGLGKTSSYDERMG